LINAAPTLRWRIFITLLADTGMRFGEAAALRWSDVSVGDAPSISVARGAALGVVGPTKTGAARVIPLTHRAALALQQLPRQHERLFAKNDGGVLRPECTLKVLHRACDRAGVKRIGWHGLRHTYATRLCQRGVPLRNVQALLGHTSIVTTTRYAHEGNLDEWVRRALDAPDGHQVDTKRDSAQDAPPNANC
jgi:integrase